jgi:transcriptional regulator with XRE-family HTH domain
MLAGVSIDYYTQLERGHARGVSAEVLDAIARDAVGSLRAEAGRNPVDQVLAGLTGDHCAL